MALAYELADLQAILGAGDRFTIVSPSGALREGFGFFEESIEQVEVGDRRKLHETSYLRLFTNERLSVSSDDDEPEGDHIRRGDGTVPAELWLANDCPILLANDCPILLGSAHNIGDSLIWYPFSRELDPGGMYRYELRLFDTTTMELA